MTEKPRTGRAYGGPLHGAMWTTAGPYLQAPVYADPPVFRYDQFEDSPLTVTYEIVTYTWKLVYQGADSIYGTPLERVSGHWVAPDYELTPHDLSRVVTDLNHEAEWVPRPYVPWEYPPNRMRAIEDEAYQRAHCQRKGWKYEYQIATPLEHGPAYYEGMLDEIGRTDDSGNQTLFVNRDVEVNAVCESLERRAVALDVDYTYADGTAMIEFDTIDDMIQFATDVKLWAMQLKARLP